MFIRDFGLAKEKKKCEAKKKIDDCRKGEEMRQAAMMSKEVPAFATFIYIFVIHVLPALSLYVIYNIMFGVIECLVTATCI